MLFQKYDHMRYVQEPAGRTPDSPLSLLPGAPSYISACLPHVLALRGEHLPPEVDAELVPSPRGLSKTSNSAPVTLHATTIPNASEKAWGSHREAFAFRPLRAAVLEKMPLVERGDPQVGEEGKENQTGAQLLEAAPPVPAEPQVRRLEDLGKEDLCSVHTPPAVTLLPFSPGHQSLGSARSPGRHFWACSASSSSRSFPRRGLSSSPRPSLCNSTPR